jgi:quinol monooxygenase YgiN
MAVGGFVRLVPKPGAEAELLERALDVAADVRTEPGNVLALVFRDPERTGDIFMLELFQDQTAIEAHRVARHSVEKGPFVHALLQSPMEIQRVEVIESAG